MSGATSAHFPRWRTYEEAVAAVQSLLSPGSTVIHNEKIADATGELRQFDVTIRGEWNGFKALCVMECKRRSRPIDKEHVEAFWAKANSVGANFKVMVSNSGFRVNALKLARHYSVGALSLLTGDGSSSFQMGGFCYARLYSWPKTRMGLNYSRGVSAGAEFDPREVRFEGKSILDWFSKQLSTTYLQYGESDVLTYELAFEVPRLFSVDGQLTEVLGVAFVAQREIRKKEVRYVVRRCILRLA